MALPQLRGLLKSATASMSVLTILAGCTSAPKTDTGIKGTLFGSRVQLLKECVKTTRAQYATAIETDSAKESGLLLSLAASLVPSVLNKLVDFAGAYAEKVGKEYSSTSTAATSVILADKAERGCIVYVAGAFGPVQAGTASAGWTDVELNNLGLARRPDVYAEFVLHSVDGDGKYAAVTPVFLDFNAPQSLRTSSANVKEVSFVIELAAPTNSILKNPPSGTSGAAPPAAVPAVGAASAPKPAASGAAAKPATDGAAKEGAGVSTTVANFAFSFGKVSVGSSYDLRALTGLRTQSQHLERSNRILNVAVTSIETENGGDFLLKLSSFLEENKKTIVDTSQPFVLKALGVEAKK